MPVDCAHTVEQQLVFFRVCLERGVLPVRVVLPCELPTDADLEQVQRAFEYGCQQVARYLNDKRAAQRAEPPAR